MLARACGPCKLVQLPATFYRCWGAKEQGARPAFFLEGMKVSTADPSPIMENMNTVIVCVVIIVFAILVMAQCSVAIAEAKAADDTTSSNYQFSIAMLVITLLILLAAVIYMAMLIRQGQVGAKVAASARILTSQNTAGLTGAGRTGDLGGTSSVPYYRRL